MARCFQPKPTRDRMAIFKQPDQRRYVHQRPTGKLVSQLDVTQPDAFPRFWVPFRNGDLEAELVARAAFAAPAVLA